MSATASDLNFDEWSRSCTQRMSQRHNVVKGGFDTAREQIFAITQGRCRFSVDSPSHLPGFAYAQARIGDTAFQFLNWASDDAECQTTTVRPQRQNMVLYIPLKGRFEASQRGQTVQAGPGELLAVSSHGELRRTWQGASVLLNVIVPRDTLARMLAADFLVDPEEPLLFEPMAVVGIERAGTLFRYIDTLLCDLDSSHPVFAAPFAGSQAERTLLHILLKSLPNDYEGSLHGPGSTIAPFFVKRAEEYARRHIQEDLSIEDLAQASAVSVRTLFYGFKQFRGTSPWKYIKNERLSLAHKALLEARTRGGKIADIAVQFGYPNPSQFSRDYKERFGVSPHTTLRSTADPSKAE